MISLPMTMTRSGTIKDRSRADAALPLRSSFNYCLWGIFVTAVGHLLWLCYQQWLNASTMAACMRNKDQSLRIKNRSKTRPLPLQPLALFVTSHSKCWRTLQKPPIPARARSCSYVTQNVNCQGPSRAQQLGGEQSRRRRGYTRERG